MADDMERKTVGKKKRSPLIWVFLAFGLILLVIALVVGKNLSRHNKGVDAYNEGVSYYSQEQWSQAYVAFRQAADANIADAAQWRELSSARAGIERRNYQMAQQDLERLLQMELSDEMQQEAETLMEFVTAQLERSTSVNNG